MWRQVSVFPVYSHLLYRNCHCAAQQNGHLRSLRLYKSGLAKLLDTHRPAEAGGFFARLRVSGPAAGAAKISRASPARRQGGRAAAMRDSCPDRGVR